MKFKYILYTLTAFVLMGGVQSCKDPERLDPSTKGYRDEMSKSDVYGIYKEGKAILQFDKAEHQAYYSSGDRISSILSSDASKYIEFKLVASPAVDAQINARMTVNSLVEGLSTQDVNLYILKKDKNRCWVWCDSQKFGAVLMWKD